MELKLKFVGINETDVITTSCSLNTVEYGRSYKYAEKSVDTLYFGTANNAGVYPESFDNNYLYHVIEVSGNDLGYTSPVVGTYYHLDESHGRLYVCDNPNHYDNSSVD